MEPERWRVPPRRPYTPGVFAEPRDATRRTDWWLVAAWSLLIYATIPVARAVQAFVDAQWGRELFRYLVIGAVGGGTLAALGYAWRTRRRFSASNTVVLLLIGAVYIVCAYRLCKVADEAVHFVEYGVLGLLCFRAFGHRHRNGLVYVCALVLCVIVGTVDEVLQWLTPGRYFDFRDVRINGIGSALMLLGIAWGIRPAWVGWRPEPRSVRVAARLAMVEVLLVGCCYANTPGVVHRYASVLPGLEGLRHNRSTMSEFGYRYQDPEIGVFKSRFSPEALAREDRRRAEEAAAILDRYHDPNEARTLARYQEFLGVYTPGSDPFMHELRVHLRSRDANIRRTRARTPGSAEYVDAAGRAYGEHLVVARYFSNSVARSLYHLGEEQARALADLVEPDYRFVSRVSENLTTGVGPWGVAAVLALVLAGLAWVDLSYGHE
jgi:hypothetical protein